MNRGQRDAAVRRAAASGGGSGRRRPAPRRGRIRIGTTRTCALSLLLVAIGTSLLLLSVVGNYYHYYTVNENEEGATAVSLLREKRWPPYCPYSSRSAARDVRRCHPDGSARLNANCSDDGLRTWQDVRRCLTGRFTVTSAGGTNDTESGEQGSEYDYEVHIVGERHSGTKFLVSELQDCFHRPGVGVKVKVHRDFIRSKHFFQTVNLDDENGRKGYAKSIVVAIFRDPGKSRERIRSISRCVDRSKKFTILTTHVVLFLRRCAFLLCVERRNLYSSGVGGGHAREALP